MSDPGVKTDLFLLVYGIIRQALQDAESNPTETGKFCTERWKDDAVEFLTTDRVEAYLKWLNRSKIDGRLVTRLRKKVNVFREARRQEMNKGYT